MNRSRLTIIGISLIILGLCAVAVAGPVDYQFGAKTLQPGVGSSAQPGSVDLRPSNNVLLSTNTSGNKSDDNKALSHALGSTPSGSGSGSGTGSASKKPKATTPEPATLILLGTGLTGVAASLKRRRGSKAQ